MCLIMYLTLGLVFRTVSELAHQRHACSDHAGRCPRRAVWAAFPAHCEPTSAPPKPERAARTFCLPTNHLRERSLATTLRFKPHLSAVTRARGSGNVQYSGPLLVSNFARDESVQQRRKAQPQPSRSQKRTSADFQPQPARGRRGQATTGALARNEDDKRRAASNEYNATTLESQKTTARRCFAPTRRQLSVSHRAPAHPYIRLRRTFRPAA
jgi:hypothetical protein